MNFTRFTCAFLLTAASLGCRSGSTDDHEQKAPAPQAVQPAVPQAASPPATAPAVPAPTPAPPAPAVALHPEEKVAVRIQKELDAAAKVEPSTASAMTAIRPVLKCVEKLNDKRWVAHFGYRKEGAKKVTIPVGFHNRFWPPPIGQGQPLVFTAPAEPEVVKMEFGPGASVAWILGQSFQVADARSTPCPSKGVKVAAREAHSSTGSTRTH